MKPMCVSVIIPVFNNIKTLEKAVNSVLFEPAVKEIFIVDDGSKDGSKELGLELGHTYSHIKVLEHKGKKNRGAAASRNLGLTHASFDWVQFLDADDELLPNKIPGQLNLAKKDFPFIVGNSVHLFPNGRKHFRKADNDIWKGLIRSKLGDTCANLWNRNFLLEVGGWDESLTSSQEYDLMFRLLILHPKIVFDNRYLTNIYHSVNSISTNVEKKNERMKNWVDLRVKIRNHLQKNNSFGIKYQYYWAGAVGIFCHNQGCAFPSHFNFIFFRLYNLDMTLRKQIQKIFKVL